MQLLDSVLIDSNRLEGLVDRVQDAQIHVYGSETEVFCATIQFQFDYYTLGLEFQIVVVEEGFRVERVGELKADVADGAEEVARALERSRSQIMDGEVQFSEWVCDVVRERTGRRIAGPADRSDQRFARDMKHIADALTASMRRQNELLFQQQRELLGLMDETWSTFERFREEAEDSDSRRQVLAALVEQVTTTGPRLRAHPGGADAESSVRAMKRLAKGENGEADPDSFMRRQAAEALSHAMWNSVNEQERLGESAVDMMEHVEHEFVRALQHQVCIIIADTLSARG